jgi:hypothetical protein
VAHYNEIELDSSSNMVMGISGRGMSDNTYKRLGSQSMITIPSSPRVKEDDLEARLTGRLLRNKQAGNDHEVVPPARLSGEGRDAGQACSIKQNHTEA